MYSLPVNRRIFLVGAMGSGKTAIGQKVAQALKLEYLDNDYGLSKMLSKSVNELAKIDIDILHKYEDQYFRNLLDQPGLFVAGVAASVGDNSELLNLLSNELVIYLHTSLEYQLLHSGTKGVGRQALQENREVEIGTRYSRRDPRFRAVATLVIEATRDRGIGAEQIINFLNTSPA
jgi:shikimate kinase